MPYFTKCCCCFSLRTGGIIMGVLAVIGALFTIGLCSAGYYGTLPSNDHPHLGQILNESIHQQNKTSLLTDEDVSDAVLVVRIWLILSIAMSLLTLLCAISWLYGVFNYRRYFMIPYLLAEVVHCLFTFSYFLYRVYVAINPPENPKNEMELPTAAAVSAVGYLIGLAIEVYFLLCMYSLYQHYREERQRSRYGDGQPGPHSPYNQAVGYTPVVAK